MSSDASWPASPLPHQGPAATSGWSIAPEEDEDPGRDNRGEITRRTTMAISGGRS